MGFRLGKACNVLCVLGMRLFTQGVSTRKIKAIAERLCGIEISSAQVSRTAAQLNEVIHSGGNDR